MISTQSGTSSQMDTPQLKEAREQLQAVYALLIGGCNFFLFIMFGLTILISPLNLIGMYLGYITRDSQKYRNLALIGFYVNLSLLLLILIYGLYTILKINLT